MNYINEIADMLNVKIDEPFSLIDKDGKQIKKPSKTFTLKSVGLVANNGQLCDTLLSEILTGTVTIQEISTNPNTIRHTGLEYPVTSNKIYDIFLGEYNIDSESEDWGWDLFSDAIIRDNWSRYFEIKRKLAETASILNDGPVNFDSGSNDDGIYSIVFNHDTQELTTCKIRTYTTDEIYFTSERSAEKAIKAVGKDNLIWMLRDFNPYIGYRDK